MFRTKRCSTLTSSSSILFLLFVVFSSDFKLSAKLLKVNKLFSTSNISLNLFLFKYFFH